MSHSFFGSGDFFSAQQQGLPRGRAVFAGGFLRGLNQQLFEWDTASRRETKKGAIAQKRKHTTTKQNILETRNPFDHYVWLVASPNSMPIKGRGFFSHK
jgi:hypothetical protein